MIFQTQVAMSFSDDEVFKAISELFRNRHAAYPDERDEFWEMFRAEVEGTEARSALEKARTEYHPNHRDVDQSLAQYISYLQSLPAGATIRRPVFSWINSLEDEIAVAQDAAARYQLFVARSAAVQELSSKVAVAEEQLIDAIAANHAALIEEVVGDQIRERLANITLDPGVSLYQSLYNEVRETLQSPEFHVRWKQSFAEQADQLRAAMNEVSDQLPAGDTDAFYNGKSWGWSELEERFLSRSFSEDDDLEDAASEQ